MYLNEHNGFGYTLDRAAELLSVNRSGIHWLVRNGYLRAYGDRAGRRITAQDVFWLCWWQNEPWPEGIDPQGYVYLMHSHHRYKIGLSKDVSGRLRTIRAQSPVPVVLIHTIPTDDMPRAERFLHKLYAARRKHFEWFQLRARDVALIRNSKAMYFGGREHLP